MTVPIYLDVHVPFAIAEQLRARGVQVRTAVEDGHSEVEDDLLLFRCHELGYLLFTQDIRFRALAMQWQMSGKSFSGLVYGHQLGATIGKYVRDLELIAKATDSEEWLNVVDYLPFS